MVEIFTRVERPRVGDTRGKQNFVIVSIRSVIMVKLPYVGLSFSSCDSSTTGSEAFDEIRNSNF
ncbi:hypothetical protein TWF703_003799 [Orbilia oligospora]|nr:hypothetical protein TWF703_003799 [Orbilia oligospora]